MIEHLQLDLHNYFNAALAALEALTNFHHSRVDESGAGAVTGITDGRRVLVQNIEDPPCTHTIADQL